MDEKIRGQYNMDRLTEEQRQRYEYSEMVRSKLLSDFLRELQININATRGNTGPVAEKTIQGRIAFPVPGGLLGFSGHSYDVKAPQFNYADDHSKITGLDLMQRIDDLQRLRLMLQGRNGLLGGNLNARVMYERNF